MNLDKLKEAARRFEQKEDWRRAIEVYQRGLAELESQGDPVPDPALYNRVGDLQLKVGDNLGAVRSYEQALDLYADQGFFNNAIALGGKILRVSSGRTPTYLRLAQLHARKNVVPEVRRHLGDYLARMEREHQLPEAITAVRGFADRYCREPELRAVVSDLLAQMTPSGDTRPALDSLLAELQARDAGQEPGGSAPGGSGVRGLVFLDVGHDVMGDLPPGSSAGGEGVDRVEGLTTVEATRSLAIEGLPLIGLESSEFQPPEALVVESIPGIDLEESSFGDGGVGAPDGEVIDIEVGGLDPVEGLVGEAMPMDGLATTLLDTSIAFDHPRDGLEIEVLGPDDDAEVLVDLEPAAEPPALAEAASTEATAAPGGVAGEPAQAADPAGHLAALEARLAEAEAAEDWGAALALAADLVRHDPEQIPRYQKQVELAYRAGDRAGLTLRYLELGDALLRAGMRAPAVAVYRRVLDHDPGHTRALGALASLGVSVAPPPVPPVIAPQPQEVAQAATDFVDLGALILDDQPTRDSRMRVDAAEPERPEDEDRNFREILDQFKRGIDENIDADDFQAHYDLGIAFKEMGLLDEAIAQFQRALRSPEGRLRATEGLGTSFYEKGRYAIAEAVLARAIDTLPGADDQKIALIYWLGRSLEAQGRDDAALPWYERALAVDIRFLDLAERIARLGSGRLG